MNSGPFDVPPISIRPVELRRIEKIDSSRNKPGQDQKFTVFSGEDKEKEERDGEKEENRESRENKKQAAELKQIKQLSVKSQIIYGKDASAERIEEKEGTKKDIRI